jgi:hypothetical protein
MGSRSDRKRRSRRPSGPPPAVIQDRFYPRGGYRGHFQRGTDWIRFRQTLGLSDTRYLAALLGVTVRSIQRWEYQGPAPRWYHAALLGLRAVWGLPPGDT